MLQKWAVGLAIKFVVRQLAKYGKAIDWAMVKKDFGDRVAAIVPGFFFDDEARGAVAAVLEACEDLMKSADAIEKILKLVADEKFSEAFEAVKQLLLAVWTPDSDAARTAHAALFTA